MPWRTTRLTTNADPNSSRGERFEPTQPSHRHIAGIGSGATVIAPRATRKGPAVPPRRCADNGSFRTSPPLEPYYFPTLSFWQGITVASRCAEGGDEAARRDLTRRSSARELGRGGQTTSQSGTPRHAMLWAVYSFGPIAR